MPERLQQELTLHIALGPVLSMTKGYTDPEVEKAYTRARELCQRVGDTPQLIPVLQGLWMFSLIRAEHQTAHELGEQLLRLAQGACDPALLLEAHYTLGTSLFLLGEFAAAQEHFEQGIARYDPQQHHTLALLYAEDPGMASLIATAWVLWVRGYPDQALARAEEALTLARKLAHPFSLGLALIACAILSQHYHRFGQVGREWAEEAMTLSSAQGFPFWLAWGLSLQGAMLAHRGQSATGIEQMRQGLAASEATGAEVLRPYFLAMLADAYGAVGQAEEGLTVLVEALKAVDKTGERYYEAELWRLKGQLTLLSKKQNVKRKNLQSALHKPQLEEAEEYFQKAMAIARRQGAKSLELRAGMSLSRLWQQQGKKKEACKLLAEIYGWFTEGFDTTDLQEAKALLRQLA